jgi:hypothetical protein
MSETYRLEGIIPADQKYEAMLDIWNSCTEQNIEPPEEVCDFFGGEPPCEDGVLVDLREKACCSEYNAEMSKGFDVVVAQIPSDIKTLRFYVSY